MSDEYVYDSHEDYLGEVGRAKLLDRNGRPYGLPQRVATRLPVIWMTATEGVASGTHPVTGHKVGPFRVLIENKTKFIPPEHFLPYEP